MRIFVIGSNESTAALLARRVVEAGHETTTDGNAADAVCCWSPRKAAWHRDNGTPVLDTLTLCRNQTGPTDASA